MYCYNCDEYSDGKQCEKCGHIAYNETPTRSAGDRQTPSTGSGAYPSNELEALREYAKATEYWRIEPHDQKERRAHLKRIASLAHRLPNDV